MDENHCPPYRHASPKPSPHAAPSEIPDGNNYNPRPGTANSARSPTLTTTNANIWTPVTPDTSIPYATNDQPSTWLAPPYPSATSVPMSAPPSLLTSEPLSRSSVSPSLPSTSTFPSPLVRRKRGRSHSLPAVPTIPKRQKIQSSPVLNPNTSTIPHTFNQTLIASRTPPINPTSLRSLDASEILKSPQLRHDLLFDALAFRPVYPAITEMGTNHIVSDMYWESVGEELMTGCRCTRWVVMGEGKVVEGQRNLAGKKKVEGCLCGGWSLNLTESDWWKYQAGRWASRLPEMINTLREILVSLMGSTTPCADHFAHSFSREALEAHERTCPTITHALVPELYQALDPQFLTSQIRRGVLGIGLFQMLGEAMKVHCAPVRDSMVDDMVVTALRGEVTMGLKKCFDCVEVMKLDIANHQVHALRPFLWTNAINHEINAFHHTLFAQKLTLSNSTTQRFIRNASLAVLSSTPPAQRTRLSTTRRSELVVKSLAKGFMDLVTSQWIVGSWPVSQRRNGSGAQLTEVPIPPSIILPETLKMDGRRIKNFNAEVVELSVVHSVLVQLRGMIGRKDGWETGRMMDAIKGDLMENMGKYARLRVEETEDGVSDLGIRIAGRVVRMESKDEARYTKVELEKLRMVATRVDGIIREVVGSGVGGVERVKDVQEGLERVLGDLLLGESGKSTSQNRDEMEVEDDEGTPISTPFKGCETQDEMFRRLGMITSDQGSELGGIVPDLRELGKKMERILGFNLKCFREIYGMKGMVAGK